MESLMYAAPGLASSSASASLRSAQFCARGCVKCAPASLSLRSLHCASSVRSECSPSTAKYSGASSRSADDPAFDRRKTVAQKPRAVLTDERGSNNGWKETKDIKESSDGNGGDPSARGFNGAASNGAGANATRAVEVDGEVDELWLTIKEEGRRESEKEPLLASYFYSSVISHRSLERALAFHLSNKLSNPTLLSTQLFGLIVDIFAADAGIRAAMREDIRAVRTKDPACTSYCHCLLYFKGFLACQAHRVAYSLWRQGRTSLAFLMQSRVSEVFHVDIHPAAHIGSGVLFDHATGLVIGETASIGNNVSILHNVTLGGTGAHIGDRHPKIGDGVLIGAGAILLGNIVIGDGAKIGSGSLVLINVPPRTTAVGNPARLVGGKQSPTQLQEIPSDTMDHTIKGWSDYVI